MNYLKKAVAVLGLLSFLVVPSLADSLTKVSGVITSWNDKGLTLRAKDKEYRFDFNPQKTVLDGHPSVDAQATCWYAKAKNGDLWLMRLHVDQSGADVGNLLVPQVGQVQGSLVKMTPTTIVVRQGGKEWTMAMDSGKTLIQGKPAIDDTVNVTFWNDKSGNLNALLIAEVTVVEVDVIEINN